VCVIREPPNKMRAGASDIPNIHSCEKGDCNKPAIRGKTTVFSLVLGLKAVEFSHSCPRVGVMNYDNVVIAYSKQGVIWRKSNVGAFICGSSLMTIGVPLLDFSTSNGYKMLRVCGRKADI
jgi:hypothetical protein